MISGQHYFHCFAALQYIVHAWDSPLVCQNKWIKSSCSWRSRTRLWYEGGSNKVCVMLQQNLILVTIVQPLFKLTLCKLNQYKLRFFQRGTDVASWIASCISICNPRHSQMKALCSRHKLYPTEMPLFMNILNTSYGFSFSSKGWRLFNGNHYFSRNTIEGAVLITLRADAFCTHIIPWSVFLITD